MLMSCSARAWQSLPSVPGRSSKRMVNSLVIGMVGTSFWRTSGTAGKFLRGDKMRESYAALSQTAPSAATSDWLEDVILAETDVERIRSECDPQPPRLTTFVVVLSNVNVNQDSVRGDRREELNEFVASLWNVRHFALRSPIMPKRESVKLWAGQHRVGADVETGTVPRTDQCFIPGLAVIYNVLLLRVPAYVFLVAPDTFFCRESHCLGVCDRVRSVLPPLFLFRMPALLVAMLARS